jgi:hypothetical protein
VGDMVLEIILAKTSIDVWMIRENAGKSRNKIMETNSSH